MVFILGRAGDGWATSVVRVGASSAGCGWDILKGCALSLGGCLCSFGRLSFLHPRKVDGPLARLLWFLRWHGCCYMQGKTSKHISFEYAKFNAKQPVVVDGNFKYYNLFDAMVDAVYVALEKVNAGNVSTYISGTGWASAGKKPYTSKENARIYDQNLYSHVLSGGTPRRPDNLLDVFIYEMFNENNKESRVEQNFGVFYPNTLPVYKFF
ncbi:glucan endo-1,3-beta-glucosidase-like [Pistacia vera]|uniref:glucan endo-1,3-beta-glucosidase-like n=1 Tax=Pistacia vera TaxID=55513 RepID=UPI00126339D0|nr:glucan endo-1,3-beta-glucosidase-like [Pistacia vera]